MRDTRGGRDTGMKVCVEEAEIRVMLLQSKECPGAPGARMGREGFFSQGLRKETQLCGYLDLLLLNNRTVRDDDAFV